MTKGILEAPAGSEHGTDQRRPVVPVAGSGGQRPGSRLISVTLDWNEWAMLKGASTVYSGLPSRCPCFLREISARCPMFLKEDIHQMSIFFKGDIRQMSMCSFRNI